MSVSTSLRFVAFAFTSFAIAAPASATIATYSFEAPALNTTTIQATGAQTNAGLTTTFSCGTSVGSRGDCGIFRYGVSSIPIVGGTNPLSVQAFAPNDTPQGWTPSTTLGLGLQGLTDGTAPLVNLAVTNNYYMAFSQAIAELSLELMDFRLGTATLDLFATSNWSGGPIASLSLVGNMASAQGVVQTMSLIAPTQNVLSAVLRFSPTTGIIPLSDTGTAIDNVRARVPEPASMALLGAGLLGLGLAQRRRRAA